MDKQLFLDSLKGLLAIESVARVDVTPECPYGTGPAKALEYVLALCERLGIRTENREGRVAWAEIGQGEEIVGILGHLDVVPLGTGWEHDPKGEVVEGRLYGRGAADDKGPVLAALFAMKALQDAGVPLKRRIRLIFGQSEENGEWDDMEYYKAHEQLPVFGFTPDASFPAIYGEKGILNFDLSVPLSGSGFISLEGGEASNMVAPWAKAVLDTPEGPVTLETKGRGAHASTPEEGVNAISLLMRELKERGVDSPLVNFYEEHIGEELYGRLACCGFEDLQSGRLTMNAGMLRTNGDEIVLTLDIRNPVTYTTAQVKDALEAAAKPFGVKVTLTEEQDPVYMDKNGKVIQSMLAVYRETTGDTSEPEVIGGGTYARAMPGIVAFGPQLPGRECTEHQKDEYILLEDLYLAEEIYEKTIQRLAELE